MGSMIRTGFVISTVAGSLLAACAASPDNPPRDAAGEQKLSGLLERRDALADEYEKVSLDYRRQCELSDGDCRQQLIDRRGELLDAHSTPRCKAEPDSDREVRCVAKDLAAFGKLDVAEDYYGFENWCFERLTACTVGLEREAADAARRERVERRRGVLGASEPGIAARAGVEFEKAKIEYMRSTLLPGAEEVCRAESENESCLEEAKTQTAAVEDELGKPDGEYDAQAGADLFQAALVAEAGCYEPESTCLKRELIRTGITRNNKRLLEKSLDALQERELLMARVQAEAGNKCVTDAIAKYQARIVQAYQMYARQRVVYFWAQLHKAFLSLHQSQVRCLQRTEPAPSVRDAADAGSIAAR